MKIQLKKEYNLSDEDLKRLNDFFRKNNFSEGLTDGHSQFSLSAECDVIYDISSIYWNGLNDILRDITGLDILNLGNIISQADYDFKNDGIYHKNTSRKLKLEKLCFYNWDGHGLEWIQWLQLTLMRIK